VPNTVQASEAMTVDRVTAQTGSVNSITGFNPPAMTNNEGPFNLATPTRQVEISLENENIVDIIVE